jgi:hypothetical protein
MTNGAFLVSGERGFFASLINLMADIAIGPAAYDLCHLAFDAEVKFMRKVEQNRARLFIIWEPGHTGHLIL